MTAPPLVAAGIDWIEGILPLLFLLFWIVSQVLNLFRGAARGRPEGPVVVRPVPRPVADDDARRELARQIEEFLREGKAPGRQPVPRRPLESPAAGDKRRESAPLREQPASRPKPSPVRPAPPSARQTPPRPAAAAPVQASSSLGSLGGHSTDVARHVRDAFAHQIEALPSGLERPATVTVTAATGPAADLATLLRNPATLRQLVLVREVLDRPVHRW